MAGKQDYQPDYDEDEHPADERLEEEGVPYTGENYDLRRVDTRNEE